MEFLVMENYNLALFFIALLTVLMVCIGLVCFLAERQHPTLSASTLPTGPRHGDIKATLITRPGGTHVHNGVAISLPGCAGSMCYGVASCKDTLCPGHPGQPHILQPAPETRSQNLRKHTPENNKKAL